MRLLLLITFILSGHAYALEVILWKMSPDAPEVLLPVKDNQSPQQAINQYIKSINDSERLVDLRTREDLKPVLENNKLQIKLGSWSRLSKANLPEIVIVSNHFREIFPAPIGYRAIRDIKRLKKNGANSYILPPLHDINLNAKESKEYRELLIEHFDAQLVLGGDDIDPFFYQEKKTYARGFNRKRDASELKFVKSYLEKDQGMTYGICRGHQLCSVAMGKKLIQDIQIEKEASDIHLDGIHKINLVEGTEFSRLFKSEQITVNSLHHQAVQIDNDDKHFKPMAWSTDDDPVIEALELKNGKGFTMQFHPELMFDEVGDIIISRIVRKTIQNRKIIEGLKSPCLKTFNSYISKVRK